MDNLLMAEKKNIFSWLSHFFLLDRIGRYDSLEGLRGLAILMVFSVHFFERYDTASFVSQYSLSSYIIRFLHSGQIGVDLFFVLSGFFIARNLKKNPTFFRFLSQRFHRLLPPHIAVLLFIIITNGIYKYSDIFLNTFFLSIFIKNAETINIVTWSLGYELAFYLGYILWEMISRKYQFLHSMKAFFITAFIFWSSQFWGNYILHNVFNDYLVLPEMNRFLGFFWGILLSKLLDLEYLQKTKNILRHLIIPSLVGLIFLQYYFEWGRYNRQFYFFTVDLIFFIIAANLLVKNRIIEEFFSSKILRLFGVLSYSLYLVHVLCIDFTHRRLPIATLSTMVYELLFAIAVTLIVSTVIFTFLERPYFTKKIFFINAFKSLKTK